MSYRETEHLRVLIANERKDRLALVAPTVANLGHEVIAREIDVHPFPCKGGVFGSFAPDTSTRAGCASSTKRDPDPL
jgi:hypothetical protein